MTRTESGRPVLSVCLIVRNASETLEACLKSVRDRMPQAEICVVDTMSGDEGKTWNIAKRYADRLESWAGPDGTWTPEMYAFDDAAAARNKSFELATGAWVMWIDADDTLPGADEAERLLKLNGRWEPSADSAGAQKVVPRGEKPEGLIEFLSRVGDEHPALDGFWAPYLYRRNDEEGRAHTWQIRERIIRNNHKWTWRRKAHEVLVPILPGTCNNMSMLAHLLFVHEKKWDDAALLYSLKRHNAILHKDYVAGARVFQDLLYMENYSQFISVDGNDNTINPLWRKQLIDDAIFNANMPNERSRALIRKTMWAMDNGFYLDAMEAGSAAIALDPVFPDGYFALAQVFAKAGRWSEAAQAFERGSACDASHPFSDVAPREHTLAYRVRGAYAYFEAARQLVAGNKIDDAIAMMDRSVALVKLVLGSPMTQGEDRSEAQQYLDLLTNQLQAYQLVPMISLFWNYLVRNEETDKARKLLAVMPHTLADSPLVQQISHWAKKLTKHMQGGEAYWDFYKEIGTDSASVEEGLTLETCLPRVHFAIETTRQHFGNRPIEVLEVGTWDGITGLPFLLGLPSAHYTALEASQVALDRFVARAEARGLGKRLTPIHGTDEALSEITKRFDVVIFHEVIEHVPSPRHTLWRLRSMLRSGDSLLFVSTPHGAYDSGNPPSPETRDARGHVRAMMPRDLVDVLRSSGLRPIEMGTAHSDLSNRGSTLHSASKLGSIVVVGDPTSGFSPRAQESQHLTTFAVGSALWDWNASNVIKDGIGASEETIVYLARKLAEDRLARVEVFGPVPHYGGLDESEVRHGVAYWPREQNWRINPRSTVVVSRSPSYGAVLDHQTGAKLDKILWLQDAWYPDLSEKTARDYRKIVILSEWHKQALTETSDVDPGRFTIIPNFLLAEHFNAKKLSSIVRLSGRFIYASSPDRGLIRLLKIWPAIREVIPDAALHIFYGWEGCMKLGAQHNPGWVERYRQMRNEYLKLSRQPGIVERGRVNHETIADEMYAASAWLYPTDFGETFCSNAIKARAAGCAIVTTPYAALNESAPSSITHFVPKEEDPNDSALWDDYVKRFVQATQVANMTPADSRKAASERAIEQYELNAVRPLWDNLLVKP